MRGLLCARDRFLKREGRGEDVARELAHGFFARLLEGGALKNTEQERGRFCSYLLGALKHFLADQRDHAMAAKGGGGLEHTELYSPGSTSAVNADEEFQHLMAALRRSGRA